MDRRGRPDDRLSLQGVEERHAGGMSTRGFADIARSTSTTSRLGPKSKSPIWSGAPREGCKAGSTAAATALYVKAAGDGSPARPPTDSGATSSDWADWARRTLGLSGTGSGNRAHTGD